MHKDLFDRLIEYSESDVYSFSMPGHKRLTKWDLPNPYLIDITEIAGFDNLHDAKGILADIEKRAAEEFGGRYAFMSVNGSTAGILASVFSLPKGSNVLVARNCHKSVFDACSLNGLKMTVVEPEWIPELELYGGISPRRVKEAFEDNESGFSAAIITSPTYEGFVSDVKAVADIVHGHGSLLIVDSAHGAHFHFSDEFPSSAIELNADIAALSLHKTLPSLNQTALVLVNEGSLAKRVGRILDALTTTSPSYILMASIDRCVTKAVCEEFDFKGFIKRLKGCRQALRELTHLSLAERDLIGKYGIFDIDISKIVLYSKHKGVCGSDIYDFMLQNKIQMEYAGSRHALAIATVADSDAGFERLISAAKRLDAAISNKTYKTHMYEPTPRTDLQRDVTLARIEKIEAGKTYDGFIYLYPPGSPLIIPGEMFTEAVRSRIIEAVNKGISVIIKEGINADG